MSRFSQLMKTQAYIRWMIRRDMPKVMAIENASFEFPWCEQKLLRALAHSSCIGLVAEWHDRIIGFEVYRLRKEYIEILDFAVHPDFRRLGLGRQMIAKLVGKLSIQRRTQLRLMLRESNLPAQLFFRAIGFRAVGIRREHFQDTGEDGYGMEYSLEAAK